MSACCATNKHGVCVWPFLPQAIGTANPEYELALDLLANGIARSMLLDYGDFAVDARLVQIQALPRPRC